MTSGPPAVLVGYMVSGYSKREEVRVDAAAFFQPINRWTSLRNMFPTISKRNLNFGGKPSMAKIRHQNVANLFSIDRVILESRALCRHSDKNWLLKLKIASTLLNLILSWFRMYLYKQTINHLVIIINQFWTTWCG